MEYASTTTEIDIAKVAALIDGEANININGGLNHRYWQLQISLGNKDFAMLDWCVARFGGKIYPNFYRKKPSSLYAPFKRWRIQNSEAANLLSLCLNHFVAKKEQADIAVRFWAIYGPSGARTSERDRMLCEELRLKLRALTKRGPRASAETPLITRLQRNLFVE